MSRERARAVMLLATVAVVLGILCFVAARGEPLTYPWGVRLWRLLHMNMLGALLTIAGGALGVWAARARSRGLVLATGGWFAVMALLLLVTLGSDANALGGRGDTLAFWLAMALGPLAIALTPDG